MQILQTKITSESSTSMKSTIAINEMKVTLKERDEQLILLRKEIEGSKFSY